ncbi:lactadherin-like [Patiria miniata]|uniref:F5/8 type C domain-containing protein n=1 Tax=Patiria miniata TaxID=46514 RepID=A0A914B2M6_PATMI|nr:lactadherin-like [Patiria miniata]
MSGRWAVVVFFATISVLVFMDGVEAKPKVCYIGRLPMPDLQNPDIYQWIKHFKDFVRARCPRSCDVVATGGCLNPRRLGLEDGSIPDERIRSSDDGDRSPSAAHGRLNGPSYWRPRFPYGSWIEVDLVQTTRVSGVITQGIQLQFSTWLVREFKVSYNPTPLSSSYEYVRDDNGDITVFDGGDIHHASTPHTNFFNQSVMASVVRIEIQRWIVSVGFRFEVIQCPQ